MASTTYQITIGQYKIDVIKKDIKNLRLSVYPPHGRIRLAAPLRYDDESLRLFVVSKLSWIEKHLAGFEQAERQTGKDCGASLCLEGKLYLLNIIPDTKFNQIRIRDHSNIDLYEKPGTPLWHRQQMIQEWYRARLKVRIEPLITRWQEIIKLRINHWAIKQMKTRWGTCNIKAKRVWINLELAKKGDDCLEYIIVHELMHLLERQHNDNFWALMDKFLPDWRVRKAGLNRTQI